jgi:AraC family transcriptional regulator of adaptative response/methylated-DNA-[protein]-cysteine methyltransferase
VNDYDRIARVIRHLEAHAREQPRLAELAAVAGLSEAHFHRLFQRWAGVTPKDFLQCLTALHARRQLRQESSVLDAAFDAGLSGPGRLHDLMVTMEAASPGEVKSGGAGLTLQFGRAGSPFGECLLAWNERGLAYLSFGEAEQANDLAREWPRARLAADPGGAAAWARRIFDERGGGELRAFVRGTEFQVKVWRALLLISPGEVRTYGEIAEAVCTRKASRAVGSACGANLVAYVIPCHRVIRETSIVQGYRWGGERKKAMLAWEAARLSSTAQAGTAI